MFIFYLPLRFVQDMKSSSLYTRLNKHESHGSIMNITPMHSNRSVNSQPKSKRKVYKHLNLSKGSASVPVQICFERLKNSLDIVTERAANLFYNGEYKKCINVLNEYENYFKIFSHMLMKLNRWNLNFFLRRILKNDPYHCPALIILIGCLIEMKDHSSKFSPHLY